MLPEQHFIINDGWDNVDKSNKDKTKRPGKGNFVVTIGDTKIVNLIQMPRPFQKLRELNFDDVVEKILEGKYSKRRRSNVSVIIVRIVFIGAFVSPLVWSRI